MNRLSIFLISNNQLYADSLASIIVNEGQHQVFQFHEDDDFWRHISLGPDLIILDLPAGSSAKNFSQLTGRKKGIPLLIISRNDQKRSKVDGVSKSKNKVLRKGAFSDRQFYDAILELTNQYSFKEKFRQILKRKSS